MQTVSMCLTTPLTMALFLQAKGRTTTTRTLLFRKTSKKIVMDTCMAALKKGLETFLMQKTHRNKQP